jgi:hypothetical protein
VFAPSSAQRNPSTTPAIGFNPQTVRQGSLRRLLGYTIGEDDVSKLVSTIEGEISRLKDSVKQVEELIDRQTGMLNEHYTKLSQILNAHAVIKAALDFDYYLMTQKQTQVINKFTLAFQKLRNYVQAGLTNLYYRRTEGLIAAKKFKNKKAEIGGWATRTSKLISSISPRQQAIDDLPFYYRQLFLRPHSVTDDLWLVRDNDVRDAEESVAFYRRVRSRSSYTRAMLNMQAEMPSL